MENKTNWKDHGYSYVFIALDAPNRDIGSGIELGRTYKNTLYDYNGKSLATDCLVLKHFSKYIWDNNEMKGKNHPIYIYKIIIYISHDLIAEEYFLIFIST